MRGLYFSAVIFAVTKTIIYNTVYNIHGIYIVLVYLLISTAGIRKLERNATTLQMKRLSKELSFEEYEYEEDLRDEYRYLEGRGTGKIDKI